MEQYLTLSNFVAVIAVALFILYWIHTFTILYHLIRFGVGTRPKQVSLIFLVGSFCLFFLLVLTALSVVFSQS